MRGSSQAATFWSDDLESHAAVRVVCVPVGSTSPRAFERYLRASLGIWINLRSLHSVLLVHVVIGYESFCLCYKRRADLPTPEGSLNLL